MFFDTHAHYDNRRFDADRDALFSSLAENGVELVVNPGYDRRSSETAVRYAERYDFVYAAVGVHPDNLPETAADDFSVIERLLSHPRVVALGEIGLDYFHMTLPKEAQIAAFHRQMLAAQKAGKPVIIHNRDAGADCLDVVIDYPDVPCIFHCFSEDGDYADRAVELGCYISFAGNVTYRKADGIREAARRVPLDRILLETDAPYLAPECVRGQRNSSILMRHTAECIAELRDIPLELLAEAAKENGKRFFGIE